MGARSVGHGLTDSDGRSPCAIGSFPCRAPTTHAASIVTDGTRSASHSSQVITKALLALDDSRRAARIGSVGAVLAARFGASLHPLRVIQARASASTADAIPENQLREAMAALNELARSFMDALVAPPRVRVGEPWQVIIELATEIGADVIVLGARGHGEQSLGSTAANVLAHAPQSVFVVREQPRRSVLP